MLNTKIGSILGIEHPVLLAPMAGVSGGSLAAAVSEAGGLGMIGGGYGDKGWLEAELGKANSSNIGIGFISWSLENNPDLLAVALDHGPKAVMLSFGSLTKFARKIANSPSKFVVQVQTLEQAQQAADQGADIIVAQGSEAGGHCGERATLPFVPAVVDLLPAIPVLAAGGIADGRGLAAALMLGAEGVMCGSAFYVANEALSSDNAKKAAVIGKGDDTVRSSVFDLLRGFEWPQGWSLRSLKNETTEKWHGRIEALQDHLDVEREHFARGVARMDTAIAPVIIGEAADQINETRPAAAILRDIVDGADLTIHQVQTANKQRR